MIRFPKTHNARSRLAEIVAFFADDHVHLALIVDPDGLLVTTIERLDLAVPVNGCARAGELGTRAGGTAGPTGPLGVTTVALLRARRRRLAIVTSPAD